MIWCDELSLKPPRVFHYMKENNFGRPVGCDSAKQEISESMRFHVNVASRNVEISSAGGVLGKMLSAVVVHRARSTS